MTENRGWKQVGDPFDFPPTCTNSAYILKLVYTKNLVRDGGGGGWFIKRMMVTFLFGNKLGWEEEHYWKRPWNPPKEQFELKTIGTPSTASTPAASKPRDSARKTATGNLIQPSRCIYIHVLIHILLAFTYQNAQPIPAFSQPMMAPPPAPIFHQPREYDGGIYNILLCINRERDLDRGLCG